MQLLNNEEERKRRIISSLEYVQKYKGTNIANAVIEVYEELTLSSEL